MIRYNKVLLTFLTLSFAFLIPLRLEAVENSPLAARLVQAKIFSKNFSPLVKQLNDPSFQDSLVYWKSQDRLNSASYQGFVVGVQNSYRDLIRSPVLLDALTYFLGTNQQSLAQDLIKLYYHQLYFFVDELLNDPRFPEHKAKLSTMESYARDLDKLPGILVPLESVRIELTSGVPWDSNIDSVARSLKKTGGLFVLNSVMKSGILGLKKELRFPNFPGPWHYLSLSGFIQGNSVSYIGNPELSDQKIPIFQQVSQMIKGFTSWQQSQNAMTLSTFKDGLKNHTAPFAEEPFSDIRNNPLFQQSSGDNIFFSIRKLVESAQKTIFIDSYVFGGSIGAAIAKALVEKAESGVKVFIIRDIYNHFDLAAEVEPVNNYLRAYSELNPGKLIMVPAALRKMSTATSGLLSKIVNNEILHNLIAEHPSPLSAMFKEQNFLTTGTSADHSKIIIADGCISRGLNRALLSSKNLANFAGGTSQDDAILIEGPAACALQIQYLPDMRTALAFDDYSLRGDTTAMTAEQHIAHHFSAYQKVSTCSTLECRIDQIVAPFDPIGSNSSSQLVLDSRGKASVRIAETPGDGEGSSILDQISQQILSAKSQILIRSPLLISYQVVNAIIQAVQSNPNLRVYIMLDGYSQSPVKTGLEGFPNWLFLDQLYALNDPGFTRVHVRFFEASSELSRLSLRLDFNYKGISVDGYSENGKRVTGVPTVTMGTANLEPFSMSGAFRDIQVQVLDEMLSQKYDQDFWRVWNSPSLNDALPWGFELPGTLGTWDRGEFIRIMRQLLLYVSEQEVIYDIL